MLRIEKASEIVWAVKQQGKDALSRISEFIGLKDRLESLRSKVGQGMAHADKMVAKIEAFGADMREAGKDW